MCVWVGDVVAIFGPRPVVFIVFICTMVKARSFEEPVRSYERVDADLAAESNGDLGLPRHIVFLGKRIIFGTSMGEAAGDELVEFLLGQYQLGKYRRRHCAQSAGGPIAQAPKAKLWPGSSAHRLLHLDIVLAESTGRWALIQRRMETSSR